MFYFLDLHVTNNNYNNILINVNHYLTVLNVSVSLLLTATTEDDSDVGGLKLGGYEKHQQKLRQERKEDYRKYLAEVPCEEKTKNICRHLGHVLLGSTVSTTTSLGL